MVTKLCECLYATCTLTCIVYKCACRELLYCSFVLRRISRRRLDTTVRVHSCSSRPSCPRLPIIFRRLSALKASIPENRGGFPGIFSRYRAGETYSDTQISRYTWVSEYAGNVCGFFYTS